MLSDKDVLTKLIDNAAVMVFYLDASGKVELCNKKAQRILGRAEEQVAGKNLAEILFPDEKDSIKGKMLNAVMEDATTYIREKDFECSINGRHISWSINPIVNEDSKLEAITLFGQDITEIKEREKSLKNIDDSLKNIFSSIRDYALYVVNLEGKITYFGMGSEKMLGWNKTDIILKDVTTLFNNSETVPSLNSMLRQVRTFGKFETEAELISKDKEIIPVMLSINQFLNSTGKLSGFIFMAKDMTERKRLEYQIFQAEKLAALGQLSAGMAHEINNPLFIISGRLEMLLQEKFDQKIKDTLNLIYAQTDRIRSLVDRILKFSRKPELNLGPVDINEVIETIMPWLQYNKLPNAEFKLEKSFEKNLPMIKGDQHQLQEVFLNILINAYQSMPKGGTIKIITKKLNDQFAQIQISDTGVGIASQNLKNIFMPFFTTKQEGLGLGLSICYNIIRNHNGSIELTSQVNKGSTFTVKLPFI